MPLQLKIFPEKCIGCKSCELACSLKNEGELNPSKSRIAAIFFLAGQYPLSYNFPSTCKQCADAPCLTSCPADAIARLKDKSKTVVIDEGKCTGCGICIGACPFGEMLYNSEKKKAFKCELCGGEPACVDFCPTDAIVFVQQKPFHSKPKALETRGYTILSERNSLDLKMSRRSKTKG